VFQKNKLKLFERKTQTPRTFFFLSRIESAQARSSPPCDSTYTFSNVPASRHACGANVPFPTFPTFPTLSLFAKFSLVLNLNSETAHGRGALFTTLFCSQNTVSVDDSQCGPRNQSVTPRE
jgi:hypothetical protein